MPRGIGLGTTLVVISVALVLAFTVAGVSVNHLNFATRMSCARQAQNLAESVMALAIERLFTDPAFGVNRTPQDTLTVTVDEGQATLSFHRGSPPWSTNNLASSNPALGSDPSRPVPQASAHLIALGTFRGVTSRVETVLYVPQFPYAILTAAPFRSRGGLEVGGVREGAQLGSMAAVAPEDMVAAHLASNALGSDALVLGPDSRVTGDVRSAGQVEVDPGAVILGRIRPQAAAVAIPDETVQGYDPLALGRPNVQTLDQATASQPAYQGFVRRQGDLFVIGGMQLDNGVLYVDGNLSVEGGVRGSGAVFSTGAVSLIGGSTLATDNAVAVMAEGDVTIAGGGKEHSYFQGLLYTEGSFLAENISLLGVFIQNGDPDTSSVEINDSRILFRPEHASIEVPISDPPTLSAGNLMFQKDGDDFNPGGVYGSDGPVVFEAYPVIGGGWELVDPNSRQILQFPTYTDFKQGFASLWNGNHNQQGQGRSKLLGLKDQNGTTGLYTISSAGLSKLGPVLDAQLAGVAPRRSGDSGVISGRPNPDNTVTVEPSRFLSLKDRARILYWRAR